MTRYLLRVVAACAGIGVGIGLLWWRLAPRELMKVIGGKAYPAGYQPRAFIASEVLLVALLAAAGLIVTSWLIVRRREQPFAVLVASGLGGLLAAVIAWQIGTRIGAFDLAALAAGSPDMTLVEAPLTMRMYADLLAWPLAASFVVLLATLIDWWRDRPVPRPPTSGG